MFNIILFGPPGSGKGTQSDKLIAAYGLKHLSTGELLREEIAKGTPEGLEAKKLIDKGQLAADDVVISMIRHELESNRGIKGFLFDGFPRTEAQAKALDELLIKHRSSVIIMLALIVSEEELLKRLLNRGRTSGRSDDVNETVIRARLAEYEAKTAIVEKYYQQFNKLAHVNGEGSVEEVFHALCEEIDKKVAASKVLK